MPGPNDDLRIGAMSPLSPPTVIMDEFPATLGVETVVAAARADVRRILQAEDDRLVVVIGPCSIHDPRAAIDYAHARYLCLFLQQQRLLEPFYRKCRSRTETDPTGVVSLCELFATRRPGEIDGQFQAWLNKPAGRTP